MDGTPPWLLGPSGVALGSCPQEEVLGSRRPPTALRPLWGGPGLCPREEVSGSRPPPPSPCPSEAGGRAPASHVCRCLAGARSPRRTASSPPTRSTKTACTPWTGPQPTPGSSPPSATTGGSSSTACPGRLSTTSCCERRAALGPAAACGAQAFQAEPHRTRAPVNSDSASARRPLRPLRLCPGDGHVPRPSGARSLLPL